MNLSLEFPHDREKLCYSSNKVDNNFGLRQQGILHWLCNRSKGTDDKLHSYHAIGLHLYFPMQITSRTTYCPQTFAKCL